MRKRSCLIINVKGGLGLWEGGEGGGAYSRAWVLMRELIGLASVFLGGGLVGRVVSVCEVLNSN